MFRYIMQDFKAREMSLSETLVRLVIDRGISAVFLYRLSSWCYHHKLRPFAILIKQLNIFLNHCDIAYQAKIGTGIRIFHALGIVIADCEIGGNFLIYQNVTIGKNGKPDSEGRHTPVIGNDVTCFAGSLIAGAITIGDNTKIGANSVVLTSIESNKKVLSPNIEVI